MLILLYACLGMLFCLVSYFVGVFARKKIFFFDSFDFYFAYVVCVIFSCFFIPAINEFYDYSRNSILVTVSVKYDYLIYICVYMAATIFLQPLYYLLLQQPPWKGREFKRTESKAYLIAIIFCIPLFVTATYDIFKMIFQFGYGAFLANRIVLLSGKAYISLFLSLPVYVSVAYCIDRFFISRENFSLSGLIQSLIIILISSSPMLLLGGRSNLLFGFLVFLASAWLLYFRRKEVGNLRHLKKAIFLLFIFFAFLANILGIIRQDLMSGEAGELTSTEQKIPLEGVMVAFSSYENLYVLFDKDFDGYKFGGTIFSFLTGFVPRSIFPEKPIGAGPVMKNIISPGSYDLKDGKNISSVTTGLPAEGYLNFGWFGAIAIPTMFLFIALVFSKIITRVSTAAGLTFSGAILVRGLSYVNGEFFGVSMHIMMACIFMLLFYFSYEISLLLRTKR